MFVSRYLTRLQMFQFILVFIHGLLPMYYDCGYPKIMPTVTLCPQQCGQTKQQKYFFRLLLEMRQYFSSCLPTFTSLPMWTRIRKLWRRKVNNDHVWFWGTGPGATRILPFVHKMYLVFTPQTGKNFSLKHSYLNKTNIINHDNDKCITRTWDSVTNVKWYTKLIPM